LEKPLVTIADLITREDGTSMIREFKTSARSYSEFEAKTSLQATCYVNAAYEFFGEPAQFEYVVLLKTKTPRIQRLQATRTLAETGRLGDRTGQPHN
jgi:hypothetical protein